MLRHVALVRIDVSEERTASIIRMTRIDVLATLLVTSNRIKLSCHPADEGATFLRNVGSYKRHCVTSQQMAFFIAIA
jgi:hypothetical protein